MERSDRATAVMSGATDLCWREQSLRTLKAAADLLGDLECADLDDDDVGSAFRSIQAHVNELAAGSLADIDKARGGIDFIEPCDLAQDLELFAAVEQLNLSLEGLVWAVTVGDPISFHGTPAALAAMFNRLDQSIRAQPVDWWQYPNVRAPTESLRDLFGRRLRGMP